MVEASLPFGAVRFADFPRRRPDGSSFLEPVSEGGNISSSPRLDKASKFAPRDLRTELASSIATVDSLFHGSTKREFDIARRNMRRLMAEAIDYGLHLSAFGVTLSSYTLKDEVLSQK